MLNKIKNNIIKIQELIDSKVIPNFESEAVDISINTEGSENGNFYCSIVLSKDLILGFTINTCDIRTLFNKIRDLDEKLEYVYIYNKLSELNNYLDDLIILYERKYDEFEKAMTFKVFDMYDNEAILELIERHNKLVKEAYKTPKSSLGGFISWLDEYANIDENYVEISKVQTISGHAEILELIV